MSAGPQTLFDKIWQSHVVAPPDAAQPDGEALLYVDRLLIHEGSHHSFNYLRDRHLTARRPRQIFAFADHYVPTTGRNPTAADRGITNPENRELVLNLERNAAEFGITHFGLGDPRQGIVHVVGPELGITQPGLVIAGGDSHTSTHGALGCLAFGIGASEATHIMATQTIWQRKPRAMHIRVDGRLPFGCDAKDVILAIIGKIGASGAVGHVIEYAGDAIRALSIEARMTVCNMSIEAGARAGMIAADDATLNYLHGRPQAPRDADWDRAVTLWRQLTTDANAPFDREATLDAASIAPMITWGTSPEDALPVTAHVPDPDTVADSDRRRAMTRALSYMGLTPGMRLTDIAIDRVFIGSCTNSRIEDLRAAAVVARGRKAAIPTLVSPGSSAIKRQAEAEGLDRIFRDAGFDWRDSGCSMCVGVNGDLLKAQERSASTSNRNFEGRQGPGARTHLMGPAMAAAAAVTGRVTDVRRLVDPRP
ncbi:MAG: 3-isopropylmalate dehydratase large subunit [Alphaproteobacteria bacterium]|nr:3-isopropylmalate dehydratase large subunit [Alphaproteobacteria bacterium]